jgi:hypothetical protein
VEGLIYPSLPGWTLNETTDRLLKKEFDGCRDDQIPHRLLDSLGMNHIVPLKHEMMDQWRDALRGGLEYHIAKYNLILHGGVDDLWLDKTTGKIIVVDYKSQANKYPVTTETYLGSTYHQGYKIQMDFYVFLMINMGFDISETAYFYVCNADVDAGTFDGKLVFNETLVPYKWSIDWIPGEIDKMVEVLNSQTLPDANPSCENCAYSRSRAFIEYSLSDEASTLTLDNYKELRNIRDSIDRVLAKGSDIKEIPATQPDDLVDWYVSRFDAAKDADARYDVLQEYLAAREMEPAQSDFTPEQSASIPQPSSWSDEHTLQAERNRMKELYSEIPYTNLGVSIPQPSSWSDEHTLEAERKKMKNTTKSNGNKLSKTKRLKRGWWVKLKYWER